MNILNFGSSGDVGPVQYWMIYNELAKFYNHNKILIYFTPFNDFIDNDYEHWINDTMRDHKRPRPYYKFKSDKTYDIFTPPQSNFYEAYTKIKIFLENNFWFYNSISSIKIILSEITYAKNLKNTDKTKTNSKDYTGYLDASIDQQKAAIFFIEKIFKDSFPKDVILVAMLGKRELERIKNGENVNEMYWYKYFLKKSEIDKRFTFINLLNYASEDIDSIYFTCDGHMSPKGNLWTAKIIQENLSKVK